MRMFPALKRGANNRCASGAAGGGSAWKRSTVQSGYCAGTQITTADERVACQSPLRGPTVITPSALQDNGGPISKTIS